MNVYISFMRILMLCWWEVGSFHSKFDPIWVQNRSSYYHYNLSMYTICRSFAMSNIFVHMHSHKNFFFRQIDFSYWIFIDRLFLITLVFSPFQYNFFLSRSILMNEIQRWCRYATWMLLVLLISKSDVSLLHV